MSVKGFMVVVAVLLVGAVVSANLGPGALLLVAIGGAGWVSWWAWSEARHD